MKVYKLFNRILILFLIIFNISCSNNDEELKINEEKKKELINRENNLKIQEQKLRDLQIEVENNLQEKLLNLHSFARRVAGKNYPQRCGGKL